jgi:thymidylate synthase (FAD)
MSQTLPVLDHGFVTLRNISGPTRRTGGICGQNADNNGIRLFDADDTDPANVARISFNNSDSNRSRKQDLALSDYLLKNLHTSPFEQIQIWLEMKMPIFIARQFVRHRTQAINEVSGRYVTLPAEWYIPEVVGGKASNNKQGQADNLDPWDQASFKGILNRHCEQGYQDYLDALKSGVAPEHARLLLSLNHYTHWITSINLHNLMHFLALRAHSHAQIEAQKYAEAIYTLLVSVLPETMKLFDKHRRKYGNVEKLLEELVGASKLKELGNEAAAALALESLTEVE